MKEHKLSHNEYINLLFNSSNDGKYIIENVGVVYYKNGYHHREDGPAVEWINGKKEWYCNGLLTRKNGPAVEYHDGHVEYWLLGKLYKLKEDYEKAYIKYYMEINGLENYS